jgi:hypothetical protein
MYFLSGNAVDRCCRDWQALIGRNRWWQMGEQHKKPSPTATFTVINPAIAQYGRPSTRFGLGFGPGLLLRPLRLLATCGGSKGLTKIRVAVSAGPQQPSPNNTTGERIYRLNRCKCRWWRMRQRLFRGNLSTARTDVQPDGGFLLAMAKPLAAASCANQLVANVHSDKRANRTKQY